MTTIKNTAIIGLGNELLSDDGIGIKIVKKLQKETAFPACDFICSMNGGFDIVEIISNYSCVYLIDAIKTNKPKPGKVQFFDLINFRETLHLSCIHNISFVTGVRLWEKLGFHMPDLIKICAIQIVEEKLFSNSLSPQLEQNFDKIYSVIKQSLSKSVSYNKIIGSETNSKTLFVSGDFV